jgi:hypothetical protein
MTTPAPFTTQALADYRSTMQTVAEGFLQRHWAEHLEDGELFERACQYLVNANQVPIFMAQRLVYLAMNNITPQSVTVGVDWANHGDSTAVVLIDTHGGIHHVTPCRLLPYQQHFLARNTPH